MVQSGRVIPVSVDIARRGQSGGASVVPVDARIVSRGVVTPINVVRDRLPSGISGLRHFQIGEVGIRRNGEIAFRNVSAEPRAVLRILHGENDHVVRIRSPPCQIFRRFRHVRAELPYARERRPRGFRAGVVRSVFEKERFREGCGGYSGGSLEIRRNRSCVAHERPSATVGRHVAKGVESRVSARSVGVDGIRSVRARRVRVLDGLAARRYARSGDARVAVRTRGRLRNRRTADHAVHEGAGLGGSFRIPDESRDRSAGLRRWKIPGNRRNPGRRSDSGDLEIRRGSGFVTGSDGGIHRADDEVFPIERRGARRLGTEESDFEFFGVQFEFGVVGISGRIIRSGDVPVPARQGRLVSVDERERPGERRSGIVNYVVPGGVSGNDGFGGDRRIYRPNVRLGGGIFGVLRITGQCQEPDGRQNRQNRDNYDQFYESERRKALFKPETFHGADIRNPPHCTGDLT